MPEPAAAVAPRPLDDLVVLDLTTALAGPFATLMLAGLGARVIKIENPLGPDTCRTNAPYIGEDGVSLVRRSAADVSVSALNRLRNKQAITLNLKVPAARRVFADLVAKADVVVDNFSRGTLDRLGVGYSFGRAINPRIVYCSITGFGSEGDPGTGKAMDAIIQALSGAMMTSGDQGDPPVRIGVPFADLTAPLFGVIGVLSALHQVRRTGEGQHVDVSMLGAMTSLVACETFDLLERCGVPQRTGQTVPRLAPFGVYPTADGHVAICAPTESFAAGLFTAMDRLDMAADPKFRTRDSRVANVDELNEVIGAFTRSLSSAALILRLEQAGVPCAPVRNPDDAVRDPQVLARGETVRLQHPQFGDVADVIGTGMPIRFSASRAGFDQHAPRVGEHNVAVYRDLLGYDDATIATLEAEGVI